MSEIEQKTPKFRPNPKRQMILVVLALIGLGVGYGLGFVFKRPQPVPPAPAGSAPTAPVKPAAPAPAKSAQSAADSSPRSVAVEHLPASPLLPEPHDDHPTQGVRAYEEALPREIVVIMEPVAPKSPPPAPPSAKPEPAPMQPDTGAVSVKPDAVVPAAKEIASAPRIEPETAPAEAIQPKSAVTPATALETWRRYAVAIKPDGRPQVAIVMDDLGIDRARTRRTMALVAPLTLSFLAYAHDLQAQADHGRGAGHEIWLHVPMEPSSTTIDPGPNVLLTSMPAAERAMSLGWNLDQLNGFVGINNHMGSRFTADSDGMRGVMAELKKRGLAFLDSMTTAKSFGHVAAREAGVPFTLRNVFLDHDDNRKAVAGQLHKLEALARKHGRALAIGHPREETLAALGPWLTTLNDKGLQLVPASAMLRAPQGQLAKKTGN